MPPWLPCSNQEEKYYSKYQHWNKHVIIHISKREDPLLLLAYPCKCVWTSIPHHGDPLLQAAVKASVAYSPTVFEQCTNYTWFISNPCKECLMRQMHNSYQGREAVFCSSTRYREASISASIRSREGLAEHVGCRRLSSHLNTLLITILLNFPFSHLLLN